MAMDALTSIAKAKAQSSKNNSTFSKDTNRNGILEMQEAESILKYLHDLHDAGLEEVIPSTVPHNIIITGWAGLAKFGHIQAPFEAEKTVRSMITKRDNGLVEASPDRISFEKVRHFGPPNQHSTFTIPIKYCIR